MSILTTHVCDGCDRRHVGDDRPAMWRHVKISADHEPNPDEPSQRMMFGYFDLCETCVNQLDGLLDPTRWPRPPEQSK